MANRTKARNRAYLKKHYQDNKQYYKNKKAERQAEILAFIRSLKTVCAMCGFSNPLALEFHHRDPKEKEISIASIPSMGWGRERVMAEISKCDILCANCHRILTIMGE